MKYLILAGVLFIAYKMFFGPSLPAPKKKDSINGSENEFQEYEEVE